MGRGNGLIDFDVERFGLGDDLSIETTNSYNARLRRLVEEMDDISSEARRKGRVEPLIGELLSQRHRISEEVPEEYAQAVDRLARWMLYPQAFMRLSGLASSAEEYCAARFRSFGLDLLNTPKAILDLSGVIHIRDGEESKTTFCEQNLEDMRISAHFYPKTEIVGRVCAKCWNKVGEMDEPEILIEIQQKVIDEEEANALTKKVSNALLSELRVYPFDKVKKEYGLDPIYHLSAISSETGRRSAGALAAKKLLALSPQERFDRMFGVFDSSLRAEYYPQMEQALSEAVIEKYGEVEELMWDEPALAEALSHSIHTDMDGVSQNEAEMVRAAVIHFLFPDAKDIFMEKLPSSDDPSLPRRNKRAKWKTHFQVIDGLKEIDPVS